MDLFDEMRSGHRQRARPLAARMRPQTLDEYVGQQHFLGEGKLLRRMLLADRLSSLVFYGPPGSGKTALAHVIANQTKSRFVPLNAVSAGTKEVREILAEARRISKDVDHHNEVILRVNPEVAKALRGPERDVLAEIEAYLGGLVTIKSDPTVHQEQFDIALA